MLLLKLNEILQHIKTTKKQNQNRKLSSRIKVLDIHSLTD